MGRCCVLATALYPLTKCCNNNNNNNTRTMKRPTPCTSVRWSTLWLESSVRLVLLRQLGRLARCLASNPLLAVLWHLTLLLVVYNVPCACRLCREQEPGCPGDDPEESGGLHDEGGANQKADQQWWRIARSRAKRLRGWCNRQGRRRRHWGCQGRC